MSSTVPTITSAKYDAVLFDLDGVLTATARVHAACWKRMFDEFLRRRSEATGEPFREFDIDSDYAHYVDGKPRYDGVRSFLESRGIELPFGDPEGPPGYDTVTGLGNRKDELVSEALEAEGVEVYEGSVRLLRRLREEGIKTAVVTSSRNCRRVLRAAGIDAEFDARMDGKLAEELGLKGKPAPDTFLEAAKMVGARAERSVVVEDAISGVQAGRAGGFALVIGVDRKGDPGSLRQHGADAVVRDLGELLD